MAMENHRLELKKQDDMIKAGYKPVPFFTYTGNKSVDDPAYAKAVADCKLYDPHTFALLFN
jgi:hypothetical protein